MQTQDIAKRLEFYVDILGMQLDGYNNRYAVKLSNYYFNLHHEKTESQAAARTIQRTGVCGPIDNTYLRDPDENLIKIIKKRRKNE